MYRGGFWRNGAGAGVFFLSGYDSRGSANSDVGFRAAYIPEIR